MTVHPDWSLGESPVGFDPEGIAYPVPVIDDDWKVEGVISETNILDLMLNRSHFRLDRLGSFHVRDAMNEITPGCCPTRFFHLPSMCC